MRRVDAVRLRRKLNGRRVVVGLDDFNVRRVRTKVTSGIARLDNRKIRDVLGGKGQMLDPEQVLAVTGHSVGGVGPFGLLSPLPVYCDISLRRFKEVVPAAGSTNAALRIATERLAELTGAIWVDVCR